MKTIFRIICLILTMTLLFTQCDKYDILYEIPDAEKFIYKEGDTLRYIGSNESVDTFYVFSYIFESVIRGPGVHETWFGTVKDNSTSKIDHCNIKIARVNDNLHLDSACYYAPYYYMKFVADESGTIPTSITRWCEEVSYNDGLDPILNIGHITFNQKEYSNVFSAEVPGHNLVLYWNLKYGIIRFEGINEDANLYWDLESKF